MQAMDLKRVKNMEKQNAILKRMDDYNRQVLNRYNLSDEK
jgi:hypothetical protein